MNIINRRCENCGSSLDMSGAGNKKTMYCESCGTPYLVDDGTRNINYTYKKEDIARIVESNNRTKIKQLELDDDAKQRKLFMIVMIPLLVLMMLVVSSYIGCMQMRHTAEDRSLHKIVVQIEADIENEDYDAALIKASTLYYTTGWSNDTEKKWNDTRITLINRINTIIRNTPLPVSLLIGFTDTDAKIESVTITIIRGDDKVYVGEQVPGTLNTYSTELKPGEYELKFAIGKKSTTCKFTVSKTDDYHYVVTGAKKGVFGISVNADYNGLITSEDVEGLLS